MLDTLQQHAVHCSGCFRDTSPSGVRIHEAKARGARIEKTLIFRRSWDGDFRKRETIRSHGRGETASHRCLSVKCFAPLPRRLPFRLARFSRVSWRWTREWAPRDWPGSAARLTLSFSIGAAGGYSQSGKGGLDSLRAQHVATFAWFLPPLNTCSPTYVHPGIFVSRGNSEKREKQICIYICEKFENAANIKKEKYTISKVEYLVIFNK